LFQIIKTTMVIKEQKKNTTFTEIFLALFKKCAIISERRDWHGKIEDFKRTKRYRENEEK